MIVITGPAAIGRLQCTIAHILAIDIIIKFRARHASTRHNDDDKFFAVESVGCLSDHVKEVICRKVFTIKFNAPKEAISGRSGGIKDIIPKHLKHKDPANEHQHIPSTQENFQLYLREVPPSKLG